MSNSFPIQLTIILPIKDRHECTLTWLQNNYSENFEYIIADGSYSNENKEIFDKYKKKNIQYIRFKPDTSYRDYYKKMYECTLLIKTNFVMQSDNDDYLNHKGINKIISTLIKKNKNIGSGYTSHILKKNELFRHINFEKKIDFYIKNNNFQIYENFFDNYIPLFYSVFSSVIFKKIYLNIVKSDIYFLSSYEYLFTLLAIKYGDITKVKTNHYIRLINTISSTSVEYKKIIKIQKYYEIDFLKIVNILFLKKSNAPKNFISKISNRVFRKKMTIQKNLYLSNLIILFLKKIFHPYMNIKFLRLYLYYYSKLF